MSPKAPTTSPVRNGFRSTSLLRTIIRPPIAMSTSGITYAATPKAPWSPSTTVVPTAPPSQPSQSSVARKRPTATMPSPQSSG